MNVKVDLDTAAEMLVKRGLQANGAVQRYFTVACAREMDAYVPMQTGMLKNNRIIGLDTVTYNMPYARYHREGKLMVTPSGSSWAKKGERKALTAKDLTYHGAPMRGPFWDKRMWADKKPKILKEVANFAGGRAEL